MKAERIRVTGIVQGVGFRPTVWRLARECNIRGQVLNDAEGVLIHAWGEAVSIDNFLLRLEKEQPPLSQIDRILRTPDPESTEEPTDFSIVSSREGETRTGVAADAATCPQCLADVKDPDNRRYRYPFTNCTHCGPRLSIVRSIPYDRANTSMSVFPMCDACQAEYEDPSDRRFHAQPNACADCGPEVWLEDTSGTRIAADEGIDVIETAARRIRSGSIVAIKGIGGIHLACDAANEEAVNTLRQRKHRYHKALALMARDPDMVEEYAEVNEREADLLADRAAPIVVLQASGKPLAAGVAPDQDSLGFMLPYTPLHHLLMESMESPIVLTSGNRSEEPQTIENHDAHRRLDQIADLYLLHNRDIVNRLDDSVVRVVDGERRFLRRARGYAPKPLHLPASFGNASGILAMGGELKNTFCLLKDGQAILSQHMGDLEDAATFEDYRHNLELYRELYDFQPDVVVVDKHPNYLSTQLGRGMAEEGGVRLVEVQHHHAHVAACMAEYGLEIDAGKVLGVALDGLGYGEDGGIWGGEFLIADYRGFERAAWFEPVAMLGGAKAMYEPWRNTFAHLRTALGWELVAADYADLDIVRFLTEKPLSTLEQMADRGLNSPLASSAGRLFDAVAAAVGVSRESAGYEGQAAIELESLARPHVEAEASQGYPWEMREQQISWRQMWHSLLLDLSSTTAPGIIAARFHQGVAQAVAQTAGRICRDNELDTVVLSGGVFQNRLLLEGCSELLRKRDLTVLSPRDTPANDGGLSLGQAAVAAALSLHPS